MRKQKIIFLVLVGIIFNLSFIVTTQAANNLDILDYKWIHRNGQEVSNTNPVSNWQSYGTWFRYRVNNTDKKLKNGSTITIPIKLEGEVPSNFKFSYNNTTRSGKIIDVSTRTEYGDFSIIGDGLSGSTEPAQITFSFNSRVESINTFFGEFNLENAWQSTNYSDGSSLNYLSTNIDGVKRPFISRGVIYVEYSPLSSYQQGQACGGFQNRLQVLNEPFRSTFRFAGRPE